MITKLNLLKEHFKHCVSLTCNHSHYNSSKLCLEGIQDVSFIFEVDECNSFENNEKKCDYIITTVYDTSDKNVLFLFIIELKGKYDLFEAIDQIEACWQKFIEIRNINDTLQTIHWDFVIPILVHNGAGKLELQRVRKKRVSLNGYTTLEILNSNNKLIKTIKKIIKYRK